MGLQKETSDPLIWAVDFADYSLGFILYIKIKKAIRESLIKVKVMNLELGCLIN